MTAGGDGTARVWDVASGDEQHVLTVGPGQAYDARFSPDGSTVVAASYDLTAWRFR